MIEVGSLVKYRDGTQLPGKEHMRAIGIITKIEHHDLKWKANPYATLDILVQNARCGFSLVEKDYGCGVNLLEEVSASEAIIAILSGRVK